MMPIEDDFDATQESSHELTKSQIKRLGDRLRKGEITEKDRRLLDEYRHSFTEAFETVVGQIRDRLKLEPTGRPLKTTQAIVQKLRREKTRLSQMQDIAGCRLITSTLSQQDDVVAQLTGNFETEPPIDRRERPSHGYRAVHVIVKQSGKLIEVQVRTSLQDTWAGLSEKLSDEFDPAIKYGGGSDRIRSYLSNLSDVMLAFEKAARGEQIMTEAQRLFELTQQLGDVVNAERTNR